MLNDEVDLLDPLDHDDGTTVVPLGDDDDTLPPKGIISLEEAAAREEGVPLAEDNEDAEDSSSGYDFNLLNEEQDWENND